MKVAGISIAFNDGYKLSEWYNYYQEYRDELFIHIIVDNGSEADFLAELEDLFSNSIIIKRKTNGGTTTAYNDGIKFALQNNFVDSILLIGNDIKLKLGSISNLYNLLFSKPDFGLVAPVLLKKDSNIIEDYGCFINKTLHLKPQFTGQKLSSDIPLVVQVEAVTGGINLGKRELYETVGLQDEKLFMYSDEVDFGLRIKKSFFKTIVTKQAVSWHQHKNPNNTKSRNNYSSFLMRRNKGYLAYKHFGFFRALYVFLFQTINIPKMSVIYLRDGNYGYAFYYIVGSIYGFLRIMNNDKFLKK